MIIRLVKSRYNSSSIRVKKVLLSSITSVLLKAVGIAVNLFTVPYTLNYLDKERYGIWLTISSILGLLAFADLGLGNSLMNAVSKLHSKKMFHELNESISSVFYSLLAIAFFFGVVLGMTFNILPLGSFLKLSGTKALDEVNLTFAVTATVFLLNLPLSVVSKIQLGLQMMYRVNIFATLGYGVSLLFLIISVNLKLGLPWLVAAFTGGSLLASLINALTFFSRNTNFIPRLKNFSLQCSRELIFKGTTFFLLVLLTLIANQTDNLIISSVVGVESVTSFEIVKKLFYLSLFANFFVEPMWPAFSDALANEDKFWARQIFFKVLKVSLLLSLFTVLILMLFTPFFIKMWVGDNFIPNFLMLAGFGANLIVLTVTGVYSVLLNSSDLVRKQIPIFLFVAASSFFLKIIFCYYFGLDYVIWGGVIAWLFYVLFGYKLVVKVLA